MRIKELFTVPEGQKVTEKVFGKVLISSICSILLCMACLVSTTWAWFSLDITSTNNAIQIGQFAVNITVDNTANVSSNTGSYRYELTTGEYNVRIDAAGSTASGHCIVTLDGQSYETIRIGGEDNPSEVSFKVTITENKIVLTGTTPDQTAQNAEGSQTITLTITPVWGAPENNNGLGSGNVSSLTAEIDVYVIAEPSEPETSESDEGDDTQGTDGEETENDEDNDTGTGNDNQNTGTDGEGNSSEEDTNGNSDNEEGATTTENLESEGDDGTTTPVDTSSTETDA